MYRLYNEDFDEDQLSNVYTEGKAWRCVFADLNLLELCS